MDTASSISYSRAGYVCTALHDYSFRCQQCGYAVIYCYSFAMRNVISFLWWAVNALYLFLWFLLLSDEQWNFVWEPGQTGFIRCSHRTACLGLFSRKSFYEWSVELLLVGLLVKLQITFSCILTAEQVAVRRIGTSIMLSREMGESCCLKRPISGYMCCSPTLHIDPAALPFVHRSITEFYHATVVLYSNPTEEAVRQ